MLMRSVPERERTPAPAVVEELAARFGVPAGLVFLHFLEEHVRERRKRWPAGGAAERAPAAGQPAGPANAREPGAAGPLSDGSSRANALAGRAAGGSGGGGGGGAASAAGGAQGVGPPAGGQPPPGAGGAPSAKRARADKGTKRGLVVRCKDDVRFADKPCKSCQHPNWNKPCRNKDIICKRRRELLRCKEDCLSSVHRSARFTAALDTTGAYHSTARWLQQAQTPAERCQAPTHTRPAVQLSRSGGATPSSALRSQAPRLRPCALRAHQQAQSLH